MQIYWKRLHLSRIHKFALSFIPSLPISMLPLPFLMICGPGKFVQWSCGFHSCAFGKNHFVLASRLSGIAIGGGFCGQ